MVKIIELIIFTRAGCHLCDALLDELTAYCSNNPFTYKSIDITGNDNLEQLYGTKVPVVTFDSNILCEYFLDINAIEVYFGRGRN